MKTTFAIATLAVVGASAVSVGALTFSPKPYRGSDTLYDITNAAIGTATIGSTTVTGSGLGTSGDYQGGGSGAGEGAMTAATPTQHTAPMSKMLTKATCSVPGGLYTHASAIALGLDAVDVYSATAAGATTACNGAAGPSGDNTGTGLNYGPSSSTAGGPYNNWSDMLALLYGGLDKSTGITDCNSTKRKALVSNWSNLFQNGCTNGVSTCTTASMKFGATSQTLAAAVGNPAGQAPLWHAFRRDDNSGTSDAFASLIGLGQLTDTSGNKTISASVSSSANHGFGASPYCNAINWDTTTANAKCALGAHKQYTGPGGVLDTVANDGVHRRPPPGTWGDSPDPSSSFGESALATSFQDNDPIRRPCVGRATFVGNGSNAAEEVCNLDGKLGVVLPIPPVDFLPTTYPTGGVAGAPRVAFNEQICNDFQSTNSMQVFDCTQGKNTFSSQCPSGDFTSGGGCYGPFDNVNNTSLCENDPTHTAGIVVNPPAGDGRIFNLYVTDGAVDYSYSTVTAAAATFVFGGAFSRIHSQLPMWDTANSSTKGVVCKQADATDQIGCLTQADPCSVGYAGDPGKTWGARANPVAASGTDAVRVNQIYPTTATVTSSTYNLWRKVYFNASGGFDQSLLQNTDELALAEYYSNTTTATALLGTYGFFGFGSSPNGGGNAPFCEDFNEVLIGTRNSGTCSTSSANINACNFNVSIQAPSANTAIPSGTHTEFSPVPSDPSSDPASATTSTVCGNGIKEKFEDCDNGINNGASGNACSATCRTVFP